MKIKRLKKIRIGDTVFNIEWDKDIYGGSFNYGENIIKIGTKNNDNLNLFAILMHELKEIIQVEQHTRFDRDDCTTEYIFNYNHAQHTDLCSRLAGLLSEFIK